MTREISRSRMGVSRADGNRVGIFAGGVSSAESRRSGVLAACVRRADGECVGLVTRGVGDADSRGESVTAVARFAVITTAAVLATAATVTVVAAVITVAAPRSGRVVVSARADITAVLTVAGVSFAPAAVTLATRNLSPEDDDCRILTGGVDNERLGNVYWLDLGNVGRGNAGLGIEHPVLAVTVVKAATGIVETIVATVPPAKVDWVTTGVAVGVRVAARHVTRILVARLVTRVGLVARLVTRIGLVARLVTGVVVTGVVVIATVGGGGSRRGRTLVCSVEVRIGGSRV